MVILTCILACVGLIADAASTRSFLREGFPERNGFRRFLIRVFGLTGGTYGVALAASVVVVAVNLLSKQPTWGLVLGNCIIVAICGLAYRKNSGAV